MRGEKEIGRERTADGNLNDVMVRLILFFGKKNRMCSIFTTCRLFKCTQNVYCGIFGDSFFSEQV